MKYYKTESICAREIGIEVDNNGVITDIEFCGGCDGNTQGLEMLIKGMTVDEVVKRLKGIDCKGRGTSCPDQLSKILRELKEENK